MGSKTKSKSRSKKDAKASGERASSVVTALGESTLTGVRTGNQGSVRRVQSLAETFIAAEKEGLIFDDRAAHIAAELVEDQRRIAGREKVARVERRIAMKFP